MSPENNKNNNITTQPMTMPQAAGKNFLSDHTCLPALEDPGPIPAAAPPLPDPGTGGLLAFPESTPDPMPDSF